MSCTISNVYFNAKNMYYLYQKERYHESILCSHFDMILKNLSKIYMALERKIADKNKSFFKL